MYEGLEEDSYLKRDVLNAENHLDLELKTLYVALGVCFLVAFLYAIFKSMRNYKRANATDNRKERIAQLC